MLVNYKSLHHKSRASAPDLAAIIEELYVNISSCYPSEDSDDAETEDEFVKRIIGYLHRNAEATSRSSGPTPKRARKSSRSSRSFEIRGVKFRDVKNADSIEAMKNRWELFVLFGGGSRNRVEASCLVHFNDIYGTCEIHEVCVATPGKGLCKTLITQVRNFIRDGHSGAVREILIYCEKSNPAACRCYASVFAGADIVITSQTTAFKLKL